MDILFKFAAKMRAWSDVIGLILLAFFVVVIGGTFLGFWIAKQIKKVRTKQNDGNRD